MFSTILTEAGKYFNQRAMVSAFFPGFVFWGIAVVLWIVLGPGTQAASAWWTAHKTAPEAFLLLLAFFVWVAFWAFLTLNFHGALLRMYEGRWPVEALETSGRKRWLARYDALVIRDETLEKEETAHQDALEALRQLRGWIQEQENASAAPCSSPAQPAKMIDDDLPAFEASLRLNSAAAAAPPPGHPAAAAVSTARRLWEAAGPCLPLRSSDAGWKARIEKLEKLTGILEKNVQSAFDEVEARRLTLNHEMFLRFPAQRDDVMPTALGNVLRAAEGRVWMRYGIDAVLVWSRLQPLLPDAVAGAVSDARTSLNLMLTTSASALLFGVPLAAWAALSGEWRLLWWVPFLVLAAALLTRQWVPVALAAVAVFLEVVWGPGLSRVVTFVVHSLGGSWTLAIKPVPLLRHAELLLGIMAALWLFAWTTYRTAVEAGLAYGEKIQAAFDLHRWKVLEGMNLQLPPDYVEEREIWRAVGGLLARGYSPRAEYFAYTRDEKKTKAPVVTPTGVLLPVPARPLPPFRQIEEAHLTTALVAAGRLPVGTAAEVVDLVGKWPLAQLPAGEPVLLSVLAAEDPLLGHAAVGIDAPPELVMAGILTPGVRVDVTIIPSPALAVELPTTATTPPLGAAPVPETFSDLRVLDARVLEGRTPVVTVALPMDRQADFAARQANGTVFVARRG